MSSCACVAWGRAMFAAVDLGRASTEGGQFFVRCLGHRLVCVWEDFCACVMRPKHAPAWPGTESSGNARVGAPLELSRHFTEGLPDGY